MRKVLASFLFSLALVAGTAAQENQDKSVTDKTKSTVNDARHLQPTVCENARKTFPLVR